MTRILLGCSLVVLAGALAGCSATAGPPPAVASAPTAARSSAAVPDDTRTRFDRAARAVVRGHERPTGRAFAAALDRAGFPADRIEVTPDRTAVGRDVPSVQFAIRDGGRCVVGQFGPGSAYRSAVVPAIAGRCLVGALTAG